MFEKNLKNFGRRQVRLWFWWVFPGFSARFWVKKNLQTNTKKHQKNTKKTPKNIKNTNKKHQKTPKNIKKHKQKAPKNTKKHKQRRFFPSKKQPKTAPQEVSMGRTVHVPNLGLFFHGGTGQMRFKAGEKKQKQLVSCWLQLLRLFGMRF